MRALYILLLLTACLVLPANIYGQTPAQLDSLIAELPAAKEDTNKINLLIDIATLHINTDSPKGLEYALEYALESKKLAEQLNWEKGIRKSYAALGQLYFKMNDFVGALDNVNKAIQIAEKGTDKAALAGLINNKGLIYSQKGELDNALDYYLQAAAIKKEAGIAEGLNEMVNMGMLYFRQQKYTEALEVFGRALEKSETEGNTAAKNMLYGNISAIYGKQKNFGKSLEYAFKSFALQEASGNKNGMALALTNIGASYKNAAKENPGILPDSLKNSRENLLKAALYLKKAEDICLETKYADALVKVYWNLGNVYEGLHDYEAAATNFHTYAVLNDSISSINKEKEFAKVEAEFTVRAQTDSLKFDNALKNKEIQQRKLERNASALAIALVGLIIVLFINRLRLQQKRKTELADAETRFEKERATQQLNTFTASIREKNELIEQFTETIEKYQALPCSNQLPEKDIYLDELQNSVILTDDQWLSFQSTFDKVHTGYIQRLNEKFEALTQTELRFSLLTRLGLNNKEMAAMQGVGLEAIRVVKHRLLKKLDLPEGTDFEKLVFSI